LNSKLVPVQTSVVLAWSIFWPAATGATWLAGAFRPSAAVINKNNVNTTNILFIIDTSPTQRFYTTAFFLYVPDA
jgi:hypothetical protein